jgi:hypothetical protein
MTQRGYTVPDSASSAFNSSALFAIRSVVNRTDSGRRAVDLYECTVAVENTGVCRLDLIKSGIDSLQRWQSTKRPVLRVAASEAGPELRIDVTMLHIHEAEFLRT